MPTTTTSSHVLAPIADASRAATAGWRRWLRALLIVAIVIAAAIGLRLTYLKPAAVPVATVVAEIGRVEEVVSNNKAGTITARRRAMLGTEIGGRVTRLPVKEGDRVKRGDLLVVLSDGEVRAHVAVQERTLDTARSAAVEACAQSDLAGRDLVRMRQLAADQLVSRQALDQAESRGTTAAAACQTADASVRQAEAGLALARVSLEKTSLRAPFGGVVSKLSTQLGEWITPAPTGLLIPPVIDLIDTDSIYVRAPLDEVDAAKIRPGLPVRITMDAFAGQAFPGRITHVASSVSEAQQQNRTFDVEVAFDDVSLARTLLPGTSADVEIIIQARDHVLRVPTSAILQGPRVLVVRNEILVAVPVRIGLSNWDVTEIVDGLASGDRIVTSLDRLEVREGARVRVSAGEPR